MEDLFETNKSILLSMIIDEEKLLTYVSLSKELCIHVNTSKILLRRTVEHIRKCIPDQEVNVSYILSGVLKNNNSRTIVCSEQDLDEDRKCFKNIYFEHIYSVSKGRSNTDNASLLTANKFDDFVLCSGLIKSDQCQKRTSIEIGNLKSSSQEVILPEKSKSLPVPQKKIKQDSVTSTPKNGHDTVKSVSNITKEKSEPLIKQEVFTPKKETASTNKQKGNAVNGQKTQKGIVGFFNKVSNKKDQKSFQNEQEIKIKSETNIKSEKMEVDHQSQKAINNKNKQNILQHEQETKGTSENKSSTEKPGDHNHKTTTVQKGTRKESNGTKKLNQIKKTSKVDKKRKRVLLVSDSDSENENNDPFADDTIPLKDEGIDPNESDDEIPPTPSAINIKINSGLVNPKKKRKVIDKTYTDEDGYILTKKEEVYESCSENEEDVKMEPKVPQEKLPKVEISPKNKKISPPQKKNQPTLTNFFKRK